MTFERLTIRNSDGTVSQPTRTTIESVFYRLAEYEDTDMRLEDIAAYKTFEDWLVKNNTQLSHVLELLEAEKEGRPSERGLTGNAAENVITSCGRRAAYRVFAKLERTSILHAWDGRFTAHSRRKHVSILKSAAIGKFGI